MFCASHHGCKAYDYFRISRWCLLYHAACKKPLMGKDGAASYKILPKECSHKGTGMMGILGGRRKYICNAVQAVLDRLSNASFNMAFRATLVSKADHRFWRPANVSRQVKTNKTMSKKRKLLREGAEGPGGITNLRARQRIKTPHHRPPLRNAQQEPNRPGPRLRRRRMSKGKKSQKPSTTTGPPARQYTVPSKHRPGKRCAAAKRELGDDLLTVVALVPISPRSFQRRQLLREYLIAPAHKVRRRYSYREIVTMPFEKDMPPFNYFLLHDDKLRAIFKNDIPKNYSAHKWGWLMRVVGQPVPSSLAVCVEVLFAVGRNS